jgi:hypothetical protein
MKVIMTEGEISNPNVLYCIVLYCIKVAPSATRLE